jgi:hypothetical protein
VAFVLAWQQPDGRLVGASGIDDLMRVRHRRPNRHGRANAVDVRYVVTEVSEATPIPAGRCLCL